MMATAGDCPWGVNSRQQGMKSISTRLSRQAIPKQKALRRLLSSYRRFFRTTSHRGDLNRTMLTYSHT